MSFHHEGHILEFVWMIWMRKVNWDGVAITTKSGIMEKEGRGSVMHCNHVGDCLSMENIKDLAKHLLENLPPWILC